LPLCSALSWAIHDSSSGDLLWSKAPNEIREMASLTKIMTLFTTLNAAEKLFISLDSPVKVPRIAAWTVGTSAYLKEGDVLTLRDLLYGLMLPSGNDAA
jgi:serine-type D-Ala-D-Ala carboxypeptidase (penicillin-binding protein 5/6)